MSRARRTLAAVAALALAAPALAYVLPASAIVRLAGTRRATAAPGAVELRGTLATGATAPAEAVLWLKGGRCRLELVGLPDRPYAVVRGGRVAVQRGLDRVPGALALAEGACALLGPTTPDALAQSLARHGVALGDVALGRLGNRVAYVLGGRPKDPAPQAWIDKTTLAPLRLVADLGGARRDLRLLDQPPPPPVAAGEKAAPPSADELFPRSAELHGPEGLQARLAIRSVSTSARIADALL